MNARLIVHLVAILVFFLGLSMLAPLGISIYDGDGSVYPIVSAMLIACALGGAGYFWTRGQQDLRLSHRDGVMIVTFGWVTAGLAAMLPYILSGAIPGFTDAYFESISGFTTTGASILTDIERLPRSILLWRSQTQWLGGMGIIVLSIAILPYLGVGGMQLYKAETPSPVVDKLTPRISDTAKAIWKIYIFLTLLQIILLFLGGMSLFDAVNHAFTTMPTGGFSTKNASIAHYRSAYIDGVVILFMLIAGMSFALHYKLMKGRVGTFFSDPELRAYLLIAGAFVLVVTWDIYGTIYNSFADAFRFASFQVVSILTTTGYATADYEKWPAFSQLILLLGMFVGSMAGSTGSGIKIMRLVLMIRHSYLELFRIIHPHAVTVVKFGDVPVPQAIMRSIWGFFFLFLAIYVVATLLMSFIGLDFMSAISSVATCLGNVGPGLGTVGPTDNYAAVPGIGKWILIVCMLLGRLEIYTILVLLVPGFWRK
ncbi:MAG: potassium transporter [Syntrophus sp. (in: bacteria)]|nr:potassium transporter [Syntrophus sp. (in: bacteria)]